MRERKGGVFEKEERRYVTLRYDGDEDEDGYHINWRAY